MDEKEILENGQYLLKSEKDILLKLAEAEAERIYASTPREDVFKIYFKDWGTMNMWSNEKWEAYLLALEIHNLDKAAHPEDHKKMPQKQHWNCWEEDNCSCGFCSSCDSSD